MALGICSLEHVRTNLSKGRDDGNLDVFPQTVLLRRLDESVGCTIIRRNWGLDLFPKTVAAKNTAIFTGCCLGTISANSEMAYFRKRKHIQHIPTSIRKARATLRR